MNHLKKTSLAMIAAGLLTAGASGVAQAEALATSVLEMTNFVLKHSVGTIYDISQFGPGLVPASSASISATYNGASATAAGGPTPTGGIDLLPVCVGPACPLVVNNAFPRLFSPVNPAAAGGNAIAADQFEAGSPITGQINPITGLPIPPGAVVKSGSWANLLDPSGGPNNAEANNQLSATWIFTPGQNDSITFSFDAAIYQESYLSALETFPASAQTSSQFFFKITNQDTGVVVFDFTPNGIAGDGAGVQAGNLDPFSLNQGTARSSPFNGVSRLAGEAPGVALTGTFLATSPVLLAGTTYRLEATLKTTATAITQVPEPSVLALFGISLLGMAATRRRKNHTVA